MPSARSLRSSSRKPRSSRRLSPSGLCLFTSHLARFQFTFGGQSNSPLMPRKTAAQDPLISRTLRVWRGFWARQADQGRILARMARRKTRSAQRILGGCWCDLPDSRMGLIMGDFGDLEFVPQPRFRGRGVCESYTDLFSGCSSCLGVISCLFFGDGLDIGLSEYFRSPRIPLGISVE